MSNSLRDSNWHSTYINVGDVFPKIRKVITFRSKKKLPAGIEIIKSCCNKVSYKDYLVTVIYTPKEIPKHITEDFYKVVKRVRLKYPNGKLDTLTYEAKVFKKK